MENTAIIDAFRQVCKALYGFLVETLPNLLNIFSKPMLELIRSNSFLSSVYDILIAILPEAHANNVAVIFSNNNVISFLVGGALGLVFVFSLVRAILKLFVGTL